MHVAYVKRMSLRQREGHSHALDPATAGLGLMSQRAAVGLVHVTVPQAASYFYLSRGNPRNYPITSCPRTHLCQQLFLEVTDFKAGRPVIHSDFK